MSDGKENDIIENLHRVLTEKGFAPKEGKPTKNHGQYFIIQITFKEQDWGTLRRVIKKFFEEQGYLDESGKGNRAFVFFKDGEGYNIYPKPKEHSNNWILFHWKLTNKK